jgi:hypothetical protein
MSNRCLNCHEAWDFEDYACPVCDRATVEQDSNMEPTLEYVFENDKGQRINPYLTNPPFERDGQTVSFVYDVVRISTGKSVFEESEAA